MKKIRIYLGMAGLLFMLGACNKEIDNWYSAAYDYSGRFIVAASCQENPGKNVVIDKGNEIQIYNTAANVANEIWLDDVSGKFPLKGKFTINGAAGDFTGNTAGNLNSVAYIFNAAYNEYIRFVSSNKADFPVATAAGQTVNGIQEYTRISLQEGKITPNGATTIGGNTSDGITLKLTLSTDNIQFVSKLVPAADWATPGVPEYTWEIQPNSAVPDASKDEHWTLSGYRYTGLPEDM